MPNSSYKKGQLFGFTVGELFLLFIFLFLLAMAYLATENNKLKKEISILEKAGYTEINTNNKKTREEVKDILKDPKKVEGIVKARDILDKDTWTTLVLNDIKLTPEEINILIDNPGSIPLIPGYKITEGKLKDLGRTVNENNKEKDNIKVDLTSAFTGLKERGGEFDAQKLMFVFPNSNKSFGTGSSKMTNQFKKTLSWFCPKLVTELIKHGKLIHEIRVEGHTSSEWKSIKNKDDAFFLNMKLSQNRTNSVLSFCSNIQRKPSFKRWLSNKFISVGMSSRKLIFNQNMEEDKDKSRRVEFRIITNSDNQLKQIQKQIQQQINN